MKPYFAANINVTVSKNILNIYEEFKDFTMVPYHRYLENLIVAEGALARIDGDVVECGTWKGGMACGLMRIGGPSRTYHFFDSFEGLPTAQEIDGERAMRYQKETDSAAYFDNCKANYEDFSLLINSQGISASNINIYKGWFDNTIPRFPLDRTISILRLDGDWYNSTMCCLDGLYDKIAKNGVVLIDDYYDWTGCSRAVHDFLSKKGSFSQIMSTPMSNVAYVIKLD